MKLLLTFVLSAFLVQEPPAPAAEAPSSVERMVVMGASLSAGFGLERTLGEALEASLRTEHDRIVDLGDILFFTAPLATGARQVEGALDLDPTLAVAIDFLFWFGYGTIDAQGGPIELESERLELLERGLALLDELECPLVVGDFPDMSAAVGGMLIAEQVPAPATLPLLSRRVREWAAARERTYVLPLSELVGQLGSTAEIRIGRHVFPAGSKLLQPDRLHPTLDGLAAMAQLVADELVTHQLAREEDWSFGLKELVATLRAPRSGVGVPTAR
jgi:hypothetical protein